MDADMVWQLTEHVLVILPKLRRGELPASQEIEQLQRDIEVVRSQLRRAEQVGPDQGQILVTIERIATEASRHSTPQSLALELICMELDKLRQSSGKQKREQGTDDGTYGSSPSGITRC